MSRVLNMSFGSDVHNYVDNPINSISMPLSAEIISSLEKWDSRIKVDQVVFNEKKENLTANIIYNASEISKVDLT
jgi:phage baseplate assembly protein W